MEGIKVSEVTRKDAHKENDILDKISKEGTAYAASLDNLFQAKGRASTEPRGRTLMAPQQKRPRGG